MSTQSTKRSGFSAVIGIIAIVLVIGVAGLVTWRLYGQPSTKANDATSNNQNTSKTPISNNQNSTPTPQPTYLDIKELGIKIQLDDSIKDATYNYDASLNAQADPKQVTISTKSLASASNGACNLGTIIKTSNQNLTGVPLTPNGSTIFKLGSDYYYFTGPQALCSNDTSVGQLLTQQKTTFRNDFKTVQLDQ